MTVSTIAKALLVSSVALASDTVPPPDTELHEIVYEFSYLRDGVLFQEPVTATHYRSILVCPHGDTCFIANVWKDGHAMRQEAITKLGKAEDDLDKLIESLEAYEAQKAEQKP